MAPSLEVTHPVTTELDLTSDDFAVEPWVYPGVPLARSAVLFQGRLHDLDHGRVGDRRLTLDDFLRNADAAGVEERTLVVAVGSNASPVVTHRKFAGGGVSTTVPMVTATLRGVGVGHSAHVGLRGFIAAAPVVKHGAPTRVTVSMLDSRQLDRLDATEPNYVRKTLDARQFGLELDGGASPDECSIYVSKWNVLAEQGSASEAMAFQRQEVVYTTLLTKSDELRNLFATDDYRDAMRAAAAKPELREVIPALLEREGLTTASGFEAKK